MHGYRGSGQQPGHSSGKDVEAAGGSGGVGADVERRYTRIYEEGINPFKEFQVGDQHCESALREYTSFVNKQSILVVFAWPFCRCFAGCMDAWSDGLSYLRCC